MYSLIRPLLFMLDAERSHELTLGALNAGYRIPGVPAMVRACLANRVPALPVDAMGLRFPNPIGLAAGLDKDARYIAPLADFGFGWLEIGTVTPRAQPGNAKPRLFRLPTEHALINRMGFNNGGVDTALANLARAPGTRLIGINIGKNRDTPAENAIDDYRAALHAVYRHAAYVAINISSPNTPGLRALQDQDRIEPLLRALKLEQKSLAETHGKYVPLALKIAPDLSHEHIGLIAQAVLSEKFDAVIATNTTLGRHGVEHLAGANEAGGLSGRPLKTLATAAIAELYRHLRGRVPIIGVGGVETTDDAWDKLMAGADLVQVYTGLIYRGPSLVRRIVAGLDERRRQMGQKTLAQAIALSRLKALSTPAR